MAGSVVFSCLLKRSSAGDCRLLLMGVAQGSWENQTVVTLSSSHLANSFLMVCTCLSMTLWVLGTACSQGESPVGCKFLVFCTGEVCCIVTDDFFWLPSTEKQKFRSEIISLEVTEDICSI